MTTQHPYDNKLELSPFLTSLSALSTGQHVWKDISSGPHDGLDVQVQDLIPQIQVRLSGIATAPHACIIDQNVDSPKDAGLRCPTPFVVVGEEGKREREVRGQKVKNGGKRYSRGAGKGEGDGKTKGCCHAGQRERHRGGWSRGNDGGNAVGVFTKHEALIKRAKDGGWYRQFPPPQWQWTPC